MIRKTASCRSATTARVIGGWKTARQDRSQNIVDETEKLFKICESDYYGLIGLAGMWS